MKDNRKIFQTMTLILQFGINMIVPIMMCTMLGVWLGKKCDMPMLTVPFFMIGAVAGFNSIYKMVKQILRQTDTSKK